MHQEHQAVLTQLSGGWMFQTLESGTREGPLSIYFTAAPRQAWHASY
jgi:hypothetical protein